LLIPNIVSAIKYWLSATLWPKQAIVELKQHPNKVGIAVWINVIFAALYAITALIYYAIGRLPAVEPWMPIAEERYYRYQIFWTIPWGLTTWIAFSGVAHLLAIAGRENPGAYTYEDALIVCGLGWVVPNAILMWIPETLLVPFFGAFWPEWIEILRLMVLPVAWQIVLIAMGLHETHNVGWARGLGIGLMTVMIFFISFLAYMR
jgi:hypothetical protein